MEMYLNVHGERQPRSLRVLLGAYGYGRRKIVRLKLRTMREISIQKKRNFGSVPGSIERNLPTSPGIRPVYARHRTRWLRRNSNRNGKTKRPFAFTTPSFALVVKAEPQHRVVPVIARRQSHSDGRSSETSSAASCIFFQLRSRRPPNRHNLRAERAPFTGGGRGGYTYRATAGVSNSNTAPFLVPRTLRCRSYDGHLS